LFKIKGYFPCDALDNKKYQNSLGNVTNLYPMRIKLQRVRYNNVNNPVHKMKAAS